MSWSHHSSCRPSIVKERGWVERNLGRVAFVVDITKGPAEIFAPLKAVLASVSGAYIKYQVNSNALLKACL